MSTRIKVINTYEDLMNLMRNLEKYRFHWADGSEPTDCENFIDERELPIRIYLGISASKPKHMYYERVHI